MARLDALIQPMVLGEIGDPPAGPASGDCYIVGAPATGAWTGREGALVTWSETMWLFAEPHDGARVHDAAAGSLAVFSLAEGWRRVSGPSAPSGGATQDTEARAAIAAVLEGLRTLAIFSG